MPSQAAPSLYQELIHKTIDQVAADSKDWLGENLLQCALVSRAFRPRSQLYMFSSIGIRGNSTSRQQRIQKLFEIIKQNPNVAHYIEELSLECTGDEYSWITEDATFTAVMAKISSARQLRKLTIGADPHMGDGYDTLRLEHPQPLVDHFFLPFIAPFITSLSFHGLLNLPIDIVASCVNLTDLELLHVKFEASEEVGHADCLPLKLQSLSHRLSQPALEKLFATTSDGSGSILDLSQLKYFTVYTDELEDLELEQQIIDRSSESLEELYILTMDTTFGGTFHGIVNLRDLSHLRQLHAHVLFPEDSLVSICQTLSTIRARSLVNLFIEAKVAFRDLSEPEVVFDADWAAFCKEVARTLSHDGSFFEFKMTYLYKDNTNMDLDDHEALLARRCEIIMAKLRREKFGLLDEDPHFTVAVSHVLEFDPTFEYSLSE
ncbi:hypothetical protein GALMADRAFT_137031 [Galerina marginata CBS 339.88]|uniref:F-box domain-containing protein n=1 Tax=Galerina marginata (strain CBS 339.88) TaxID=685588 RepID=A0A067TGU9_GALM3|nr:hypothetical protein GALMADRAFT_137031 [Galerina marginata CBS 339.88]